MANNSEATPGCAVQVFVLDGGAQSAELTTDSRAPLVGELGLASTAPRRALRRTRGRLRGCALASHPAEGYFVHADSTLACPRTQSFLFVGFCRLPWLLFLYPQGNTCTATRATLPARSGQRWRGTMRSHLPSRFKRPTVWPKRQRRRNGCEA